jgi:hypothetical protein
MISSCVISQSKHEIPNILPTDQTKTTSSSPQQLLPEV